MIRMEITKFAKAGFIHVFSQRTVSELWRVEIEWLVPMSVLSLPVSILLVLF